MALFSNVFELGYTGHGFWNAYVVERGRPWKDPIPVAWESDVEHDMVTVLRQGDGGPSAVKRLLTMEKFVIVISWQQINRNNKVEGHKDNFTRLVEVQPICIKPDNDRALVCKILRILAK